MEILMKHKMKIGLVLAVILVIGAAVMISGGNPVASQDAAPETLWNTRCQDEAAQKQCEVFQRLIVKETGQRVVEFAIGFPDDAGGDPRGVMILPLGILLPSGTIMQVDDGAAFKFDIRFCTVDGCFAFLDMKRELEGGKTALDMLRKGKNAKITFQNVQGQAMTVDLSLAGFKKALDNLS